MPNWCNNYIDVSHPDQAKLEALAVAVREGHFCNHIIPVPESLHITAGRDGADGSPEQDLLEARMKENIEKHGYANWYDFCVNRWGTKWDVEVFPENVDPEGGSLRFSFDSAWSPPLQVYEEMIRQGYDVKAFYWEGGMGYCGKVTTVDGEMVDDYYDYSGMTAAECAEEIDPELDECMCIIENLEMWEEENKENEEEDE